MSHQPWFSTAAKESICNNLGELESQDKKNVVMLLKFKSTDYDILVKSIKYFNNL